MKHYIIKSALMRIVTVVLLLFGPVSAFAQYYQMKVRTLDGRLTQFNVDRIDSIYFEQVNTNVTEPVNTWSSKSDVENELLNAYIALKQKCVTRMFVWGEMRSDNIIEGDIASADVRGICRENIRSYNDFCQYNAFYDIINRANRVLLFAPQVVNLDDDYLNDVFLSHQAEAIALRSLCYWYLIRTFRDVPYITSYDELGYLRLNTPKSSFESIIDSLINDLEYIKNYAILKYPSHSESVYRITKPVIYAMLADMYLWRGNTDDYDKCIALCEMITAIKTADYLSLKEEQGDNCIVKLFNGYPLITDVLDHTPGNSYNEIFGIGGSFESLFEFSYDYVIPNPLGQLFNIYSNSFQSAQIRAFPHIGSGFDPFREWGNEVFEQSQDTRFYQNIKDTWDICKYAYSKLDFKASGGPILFDKAWVHGNYSPCNWIVYRYTEVLLFEAEAYIMKAMQVSNDTTMCNEYKDKAFNLIDAVNKRSAVANNNYHKTLTQVIDYTVNTSVDELENLLYKERRRELMFEGKRWFDLVRMARRDGNQNRLLSLVEKKHDSSIMSALKIMFKNPYTMYFPLHVDEVHNSQGILVQNPAYRDD